MKALEWLPLQLRYALRSLARRPTLSLVALLTLGLGIGANTAVFSIVNVVLLKPLPLKDPNRLVMVSSTAPTQGQADGFSSYPDFRDWAEQAKQFSGLGAFWIFPNGDVNLTGGTQPERVSVARVTPGFFEVLGVRPLYGRAFLPEETIVGNHRRAILSYGLWSRQFGSDSSLVGRSVMVNGFPYTVVGIMPASFRSLAGSALGSDVEFWRPLVPEDNQTGGRDSRKLRVVGRLRAGVSLAQAESELAGIAGRLAQAYPETNRDIGIRLMPLREQVVRDARRGLLLLVAAVGVVLLVACVNVANLLLIKAATTHKQFAVEHALGASRFRLGAQVVIESLLLGVSGALLGLFLAFWSVRAVVAYGPRDIPLLADVRIDGTVLAFTVLAALLTTLCFGMVPAFRSARADATLALRQGRSRSAREHRLLALLTVSQVLLATVLLTAGSLLLRSFAALLHVDPGLRPEKVLTFQLELPMGTTYPTQPGRDAFFTNLLARVEGLPGVSAASMASAPPIEEQSAEQSFTLPGSSDARAFHASFRLVSPGYFSLLGIPIVRGRRFQDSDGREAPRVVMVSQALARDVWGTGDPTGAHLNQPFGGDAEVIGVAGDVRSSGLDGEPSRTVYLPASQWAYNFMTLMVRTRLAPLALAPSIQSLVRQLDADLPVHHVRTLDELLSSSVARQRFQTLLVGSFSLLVLLLAVVGTYGVVSYTMSERTGELGIRMALGATGQDVRRLVLGEGARLAVVGILLGAAGAALLSRTLSRLLYQTSALDPVSFVGAPLLLGVAVLGATWLPARRAARVDPMRALRVE